MKLDVHTLFLVTIYVEALLGLLLLFAWAQNLQLRAVAWWGFAHLMRAASVALFGLYGEVSQAVSIDLANALLFLSFAVTWTGARVFDGRKPMPLAIVGGSLLWLIVAHLPVIGGHFEIRFLVASGIITTYTWLTAYEFWRGRAEPLVSRWPAIFLLFAHGSLFLLRTPLAAMLPWPPVSEQFESVWLTVLSFEALLFTISIAFVLLAMAKERTEFSHRTAAMIDPLTGIANRRSFLNDATELMTRSTGAANPTAVLLMDLDHFKSINDRFGHAVGDRVLQIFAESTRETIRAADLFGRLGGEEFAAVLRNVQARGRHHAGGSDPPALCRGGIVCRRLSDRRDRQHRRGDQPGCDARHAGAPGAGRPGALLRQGARPQPRRGRDLRADPQAPRHHPGGARAGAKRGVVPSVLLRSVLFYLRAGARTHAGDQHHRLFILGAVVVDAAAVVRHHRAG